MMEQNRKNQQKELPKNIEVCPKITNLNSNYFLSYCEVVYGLHLSTTVSSGTSIANNKIQEADGPQKSHEKSFEY